MAVPFSEFVIEISLKGQFRGIMDKKGIIFDMDGTIWDSSVNVAASWTYILHEYGYKDKTITCDDFRKVMGKPMDVIADTLFTFTEKGHERDVLRSACEEYEIKYLRKKGGILYDRVIETLEELRKMGFHSYIVSNCQSGYIEAFLEHYSIPYGKAGALIEDIECYGNNLLQKDENIKLLAMRNLLTDACYVGDIQSDYDATIRAGYKFIHARYGFGSIDADVPYIDDFSHLINVVPKVLG